MRIHVVRISKNLIVLDRMYTMKTTPQNSGHLKIPGLIYQRQNIMDSTGASIYNKVDLMRLIYFRFVQWTPSILKICI